MKGDLKRLRTEKMELEDANVHINSALNKVRQETQNYIQEINNLKSQLVNLSELNEKRKNELMEYEDRIDHLQNQLRGANKDKLDIDAEKMMTLEDHNVSFF